MSFFFLFLSLPKIGPREGCFDDIVFDTESEAAFESAFINRKLVDIERRGKYLLFRLSGKGPHIVIHYGMTGTLLVKDAPMPVYKSFDVNKANIWPPMYTKYELIFDNGTRVAYIDPRRLGRVKLRFTDALLQPPLSLLGHDPLNDSPRVEPSAFVAALKGYSCPIKALLLNQNSIFCGLVSCARFFTLFCNSFHNANYPIC